MSNYYDLRMSIKTNSKEQREYLFEIIEKKPIGNEYYCRYYDCQKVGDCDIYFDVDMRGGLNKEVLELLELPTLYPNVIIDATVYDNINGLCDHWVCNSDSWAAVWTVDDAAEEVTFRRDEFTVDMLNLKTFRKVYDWDGNLLYKEENTVPLPVEKLNDSIRQGYEKWKADPVKWEKEKKCENAEREQLWEQMASMNRNNTTDDDDLPF